MPFTDAEKEDLKKLIVEAMAEDRKANAPPVKTIKEMTEAEFNAHLNSKLQEAQEARDKKEAASQKAGA